MRRFNYTNFGDMSQRPPVLSSKESQLLRSSLQHRIAQTCLEFGAFGCVVSLLTILIWLPPARLYTEGLGVVLLCLSQLAIRFLWFNRINNFNQLDLLSATIITPCWAVVMLSIFVQSTYTGGGIIAALVPVAAVLFYREFVFWSWYSLAISIFITCRVLADKPMMAIDWTLVILVLPLISMILRKTVNASYQSLVLQNHERIELISSLSESVSQLKQREKELIHSRQQLKYNEKRIEAMLEASPLMLLFFDESDQLSEVRGSTSQVFCEDCSERLGDHFTKFFGDSQEVSEAFHAARESRKSSNVRYEYKNNKHIALRFESLHDADLHFQGVLCVGLDISQSVAEDKQKSRQVFQAQKMECLSQLAGGVAHDFNNYLMAIIAFAESILINEFDDTIFALEQIVATAQEASTVCDQLIIYSGQEIESENTRKISLSQLITDLAPLFRAVVPKNVELTTSCSDVPIGLEIDRGQIQHAILNVLTNAVDAVEAVEHGRISITAGLFDQPNIQGKAFGNLLPSTTYCEICIADNGPGVDSEYLDKLVDLYFSTKPNAQGFGLAVTNKLVTNHGGIIEVSGESGIGMSVKLILPCFGDDESKTTRVAEPKSVSLAARRILLVDDESAVLTALSMVLRNRGHRVVAVDTPPAAVDFMEEKGDEIDILIFDYSMPHMNGMQLLDQIRSEGFRQPMILCSGYVVNFKENNEFKYKPDLILNKPFEIEELEMAIQKLSANQNITNA